MAFWFSFLILRQLETKIDSMEDALGILESKVGADSV